MIDPLQLDCYALAHWRSLSRMEWRILDEANQEILTARRDADWFFSTYTVLWLIVALFLVGIFSLHALQATGARMIAAYTFFAALAGVYILAPIAALRKPRPIILRSAGSKELLRILRRTRIGFDRLRYDILDASGNSLGQISRMRLRLRSRWLIQTPDGERLMLTAPWRGAFEDAASEASIIAWGLRMVRASFRRFRGREPWTGPFLIADNASGERIAACYHDPGSDWTWLTTARAKPRLNPLLLCAAILAVAER